jgi:nucleoside-diphosphate-sugar epimerase
VACFDRPPEVIWDTNKPSGQSLRLMDITRAKEMIGFNPRISLYQGIKETVDWYMANANIAGKRYDVFTEEEYIK